MTTFFFLVLISLSSLFSSFLAPLLRAAYVKPLHPCSSKYSSQGHTALDSVPCSNLVLGIVLKPPRHWIGTFYRINNKTLLE